MNNDNLINLLTYALIGVVIILFVLLAIYTILKVKESTSKKDKVDFKSDETQSKQDSKTNAYGKQSVLNFMEFDKIEDNMIWQKKGERFLMVVECQGVNYDLMSEIEKTGVEEGFVQFLNTLRHPIQIYVQTRTVNLESSINTYKERIQEIEDKLVKTKMNYEEIKDSENYTEEQKSRLLFEVTKQTNLYEYGKDIIYNTEKMNLNKNISTKKYYIIIPYYTSELGSNEFDKEEIKNIAFSELYTRAQSIIRTLSVCSVNGKILNSLELAELLYMAYNRDDAEVFGIEKALRAGCDDMYSTAPDVLDKKMRALDMEIEKRAIEKAQELVSDAQTEKIQQIHQKEFSMDSLIDQMVELILEENKEYIGEDIAQSATAKLKAEKTSKKGGKVNGKKEKTASRANQ